MAIFGGAPFGTLPMSGDEVTSAGSVGASSGVATALALAASSASSAGVGVATGRSGAGAAASGVAAAQARSGSVGASQGVASVQGFAPGGSTASASGLGAAQARSGSLGASAGSATAAALMGALGASQGTGNALGASPVVLTGLPGIYGSGRKKRVIPYLETPAKRRDPRRAAGQAGEQAPPPAELPADPTPTPRDRLADILSMPIMQGGALEAPLWWRELLERARATEERLALEAAIEAARIEAERRVEAERFVDAVRSLARDVVERGYPEAERVMREALAEADKVSPQAQALFDEYQKNRRRKERDEERFIILAAMELLN